LVIDAQTIYDSTESFFEKVGSREAFKSINFRELMCTLSTTMSFRGSAYFLNRILRSNKGIKVTTFRNSVEREGDSIQGCLEEKAAAAIDEEGLDVDATGIITWKSTGKAVIQQDFTSDTVHIDAATVHAAAKSLKLAEGSYNPSDYERCAINISSDEVGVKRQTESRPREEEKAQPKNVQNSVIHVELANESSDPKVASNSSYTLNSPSVLGAFKLLLGFLCKNGLLSGTLVFFADGAIGVLKSIDMDMVKDKKTLNYIMGYLERVRTNIPNYMLRAALGLRNSSNRGEKANDLIVSNRQKHNP